MATPYRNVGSIESSDALASMNGTGAFMDYDSANGYARFGSKGGVGVSLGTRIATVLNGVLQNAITIAANALTITLLAGSTLAAQAVTATSLTLAGGTVVASTPVLAPTQTWNNGAVVFTAMKLNVTNTASAAGSLLLDLQVGGASQFKVDKTGATTATLLSFSAATTFTQGTLQVSPGSGMSLSGVTGTNSDLTLLSQLGVQVLRVPTGTSNILFNAGSGTASFVNSVTIGTGLTVSAGGIAVTAGWSTFAGGVSITGGSFALGTISKGATDGLTIVGVTGATHDLTIYGADSTPVLFVPTGTHDAQFFGKTGFNNTAPVGKQVSSSTLAGVIAGLIATGLFSS